MNAEHIERTLRAFQRRTSFRSFTVERYGTALHRVLPNTGRLGSNYVGSL
jgi:hypothetical protein